jgi:nitroimidazol reductase NimA-like FMN-containing flavoprotein (pyridoxamine 5'-phosphate oxidase superfamily)
MIGELNGAQIETVLQSECICRIGCHADGETYVVPVTYAYDGSSFYCHSVDGMKTGMMRKNPKVCVEVDHIHDMANWQCVVARATFVELHGTDAREAMSFLVQRLAPLMSSASSDPSHGGHAAERRGLKPVAFRLDVYDKTGRFEKR